MIEDGARVDRFPMEMYLLSLSLSLSSVTSRELGRYICRYVAIER